MINGIIFLGDDDGIIENATIMHKVSKSKAELDYHDNVNNEVFMRYIRNLLDYVDTLEVKSIIIMDNASYHSTRLVPLTSDRKQVLYDWIGKHKDADGCTIVLPEFKKYANGSL